MFFLTKQCQNTNPFQIASIKHTDNLHTMMTSNPILILKTQEMLTGQTEY